MADREEAQGRHSKASIPAGVEVIFPGDQAKAGGPEVVAQRITNYLSGGGLFNPEFATHEAVRDLLIDCRAAITKKEAALKACMEQNRRLKNSLIKWREREFPGTDQRSVVERDYPALTQAQEALK